MSDRNLIQIHHVNEDWNENAKKISDEINRSTSTVQQLKEFRELTKFASENGMLEIFVDLYFSINLKNPIRSCIENVLKKIDEEQALKFINHALQNKITTCSFREKLYLICYLNETSKAFKIIQKVIGRNHQSYISKFLLSVLIELHMELKKELSPIQKTEICAQLHMTLQTILYCLKCQHQECKELVINQELTTICDISYDLLGRDDISLDTKNNCGILIVTKNELTSDKSHLNIMRDEQEDPLKRMNFITGFVQVHDTEIENMTEVCKIIDQIHFKGSVDGQIVAAASKLIVQILKKLLNKKIINEEIASIASEIAITNVGHDVDAIKHLAKNSLRCIFEFNNTEITDKTFQLLMTSSISTQAAVVRSILPALSSKMIFEKLPNFQNQMLSSIQMDTISSCYESLSIKFYDETCFESWFDKMINPILAKIESRTEEQNELISLLTKCIKCDIKAIDLILKKRDKFDDHFILLCLNAAKTDLTHSTPTSWRGVISYEELKKFMDNFNEEIQLSALQLLINTRKTTEEFTTEEIQCIMYYYESNISIQNPAIRQSVIAMTKKFFERLQNIVNIHQRKKDVTKLNNILEVLLKFHDFGIENLFDGSSFSRRILSLKLIQYSSEVLQANFQDSTSSIWSENKFNAVFDVLLKDNFEGNKEAALEVLKFVPSDILRSYFKGDLNGLEKLMTSITTSETIGAAFLLQFAINFSIFDSFPTAYEILIWCESILLKALQIAQKSIILSGGSYTLYGPIYCIRFIVERLNLKELKDYAKWKEFFSRMITICRDASEVVAQIVNNSSPEGIYPDEDFKNFDEIDLKIVEKTSSQMVLVNAWRVIKEISLFLGDISLRGTDYVLNTESILQITDHLLELMTKTKHRGAFEQAFHGFSQICIALRLSCDPKLHETPSQILHQIMTSISGSPDDEENILGLNMKNLCATRRSAGLPFIVQAIVQSEVRIASNKDFHFTMKNLINNAKNGINLESRVHSLNILRALFNCKELKECTMEYVSEAFKCSLNKYDAETWSERNSSTLLFSALIIKIFGPQHTKNNEELCVRSKMNAKLFFLRFPELYSLINEILLETQNTHVKNKKNAKLHPVLILLNRLCNSYDCNNAAQFQEFIAVVEKFVDCSELQTRILCAKFVTNNLANNCVFEEILSIIKSLESHLSANTTHGLLLKILNFCKRDFKSPDNLSLLLNKSFQLFEIIDKRQLMCIKILLEIIIEIISKLSMAEIDETILMQLESILKTSYDPSGFGFPLLQRKIVTLNLIRAHLVGNFEWFMNIGESTNFYELSEKLNCILMLLNADYAQQVFDRYELDLKMLQFVENLPNDKFKSFIASDSKFKSSLKLLIKSNDNFNIPVRSFEILSYLEYSKGECNIIKEYTENALNEHDDLSNAMFKYVKRCIENEDKDLILSINWEFLDKVIEASFFIKLSVLDILEVVATKITLQLLSHKTLFHFVRAILHLLIDDDIDVRCKASKIVSTILECKENFNASQAQKKFILYVKNNCINENVFLSIIILLAYEETQNCIQTNVDLDEQILFKHNESNTFKERVLIKHQCMNILRENSSNWKFNEEILKLCVNQSGNQNIVEFLKNYC